MSFLLSVIYRGKTYKDIKVHIAVEGDKLRYKWNSGLKDTGDAEPIRNMMLTLYGDSCEIKTQ